MTTETPFLVFWRVMNRLRALDGKPEWLFGEAHDEWRARRSAAAMHRFHLRMQRAGRKPEEAA